MRLGDIEFTMLRDGDIWLDGGAMFGVVPKPLWERYCPADSRNRIQLALNCLLIHAADKWILVETGAGDKWDAKNANIFNISWPPRLPDQLASAGADPERIDFVVNTHLHFDHCGWNTRVTNGKIVPMFPNARYVVQKGELEHAKKPTERERASYRSVNFRPVEETGQWQLLEGDTEIVPGVEVIRVPGHTADMQCVRLSSGGKSAFFFADLVPMVAHLSYPWIMGFDLYPLTTLENKKKWIPKVAREGMLALFCHDPHTPAGYLRERDGRFILEAVQLTEGGRV
ncbi:MAG TPA: MBL fold metallo-hydrolase [Methylomirabilota bacterium]|nr:MBL fold metallo-hydrolase [Methylomirabilota bacterium]